ncbi:hypothetical protein, partial [Streptodolium elevatio]
PTAPGTARPTRPPTGCQRPKWALRALFVTTGAVGQAAAHAERPAADAAQRIGAMGLAAPAEEHVCAT